MERTSWDFKSHIYDVGVDSRETIPQPPISRVLVELEDMVNESDQSFAQG